MAYRDGAVIFLAAGLEAADERVTLGHELGHFLGDYEWPRRRAVSRLGPGILPVLDGERLPTPAEEIAGVLAGVALAAHVHYLERGFDPRRQAAVNRVERAATELACELLAPRQVMGDRAAARQLPDYPEPWVALLRDEFGFPRSWADLYAGRLLRRRDRRRGFSDSLGL
jgi:hypothetical protein